MPAPTAPTTDAAPALLHRPSRRSRWVLLARTGLEGRHSGWTAPLLLWLASRVLSTVLLATAFVVASASGWTFASHRAHPSFLTFSGSWDASFYRTIATAGYPSTLPTDGAGHVLPNPWAFLPLFPALVRVVMGTGLSFWAAGVVVATVCGAGATVVLYRLLLTVGGAQRARRGTALFVAAPLSFLLQVSYAEGVFLLLLFGALLALVRQRYGVVAVLGLLAASARPGVLALALALAVHLVVREVAARRDGTAIPWRTRLAVLATGALLAAAGLAWPVVAAVVTGRPDAYLATETSWWVGFIGRGAFVPFTPWFMMAGRWLGVGGVVLVVAVLVAAAVFLTRVSVRRLGPDVLAFTVSYLLYLVAVFLPQQSLPRLLMPIAPLLGSDAFVGTRRRTVGWLVTGVALQPVAVLVLWYVGFP